MRSKTERSRTIPPQRGRALCLFLVFLFAAATAADTISLRNGRTIRGNIVSQSRREVVIGTARGIQRISKDGIARIRYGDEPEPEETPTRDSRKGAAQPAEGGPSKKGRASKEDSGPVATRPVGRTSAAWRSLVLPGWGQWHSGRKWEAWLAGGAFWGTAIYAGAKNGRVGRLRSEYEASLTSSLLLSARATPLGTGAPVLLHAALSQSAFSRYDSAARTATSVSGLVAVVYALQVLHAAWAAPSATPLAIPREKSPSGVWWQGSVAPRGNGWAVSATWQF